MEWEQLILWAERCIQEKGDIIESSLEIIVQTPWSSVGRFATNQGYVYIKQTPPGLDKEAEILEALEKISPKSTPELIAVCPELRGFCMKDAGLALRGYLKNQSSSFDLLSQAILQYTALQRTTENHVEALAENAIPVWDCTTMPKLYQDFLKNNHFLLETEGLTVAELKALDGAVDCIETDCRSLTECGLLSTISQPDFNTNNILIHPQTHLMTHIDLGEIVLSHPFFSLHNFMLQASIHHGVAMGSDEYQRLEEFCWKNWYHDHTPEILRVAWRLSKKLWPIYNVLSTERLLQSVGVEEFRQHYATNPYRIARDLRLYLSIL